LEDLGTKAARHSTNRTALGIKIRNAIVKRILSIKRNMGIWVKGKG